MTPLRSLALTIVGVALFAAAACDSPERRAARAREVRVALLEELKPVTLKNCNLKRYGGPNDGGYLMCENLIRGSRRSIRTASTPKTTGDASSPVS